MTGARAIEVEDVYELSPMQVGMLFQSLLAPASGVFVEQQAMRLPGSLSATHFEQAWQSVFDRTPVLRTSFHWEGLEKPVQVVQRRVTIRVDELNWRGIPASGWENQLAVYMREMRRRGFEFDQVPLMRLALICRSETETWFVWHFHHLLLDGWSGQLLLQEVVDHYRALASGERYEPPKRPPFSTYIGWLQTQSESEAEAFWRAQLRGFSVPTPIGFGRTTASAAGEGNEGEHAISLSVEESAAVRTFAKANRLTLNTLVQGAWALMLARYSGESDVVHGIVMSGRPPELPGVETMIGLFINTLPLRVVLPPEDRLVDWLHYLQHRQMGLERYQYVSSLQLQRWSQVPSGMRLYDTVVVFENFPIAKKQDAQSQQVDEPLYVGRTDVAITLVVVPAQKIRMKFLYDHRRFSKRDIQQIAEQFTFLVRELPTLAHAQLRDLSLLAPEERHRVLVEWNATAYPGYDRVSLTELLAEQAARTPDAVAFIQNGTRVSVGAVHKRSSQLAHYLASNGVRQGTVVGVYCERSVEAVIAFLTLLKLRAVFLPLDPSYPRDRLAYMAADAGASLVLGLDSALASSVRTLAWNEVWEGSERCSTECPHNHAAPSDLAYIIYTSGSTGVPKGVAVEHRVVLNRLTWMWREYPFTSGEVGVMKTALNFVDAFWEMLGGLLQGMPTVIAPQSVVSDPTRFIEFLASHSVTRLWFVPSFLEMLLDSCPDMGKRLPALHFWSSGGEPLSAELFHRFHRAVPGAILYNVFGASELWDATVFDPQRDGVVTDCVPIGRPIANTEAYILDSRQQPVPIGVTGTLYIGGASLARGYVNRETRSGQRFIPHPFRDESNAYLYDTCDLARYREDGVLEYVGRRDQQLKIRGFRVEPGEIETLIDSHPSVLESVVVSRRFGIGDDRLVAYVVPRNGAEETRALNAHLSKWLPAFMMPAIVWIGEIPMTPSGKRDRNRLPEPMLNTARSSAPSTPATSLEKSIVRKFCEVLGVETVGLDDDFFVDLGGHSLLATRLVSRLRESLGLEVPLRAVFDAPTPAALAAVLVRMSPDRRTDAETESILAELEALPTEKANALLRSLGTETEGGGS